MDQGAVPASARWSLRSRGPGHVVSHRCLDAQRSARPRGLLARVFGVDPLHPDAVSWYRGALGERRVGRILTGLGPDWRVLHAVPHGDGDADIDHLVIGPPGVFTISTENHFGRHIWVGGDVLLVDGRRSSSLSTAEHEAHDASRALTRATGAPVVAGAIVVVVGPRRIRRGDTPPPVDVVAARRLLRHLRELPAALRPDLVASVARAGEEWTTWRPFGIDAGQSDPEVAFARLHADVTRARAHRVAWQLGGIVAVTASILGVATGLVA